MNTSIKVLGESLLVWQGGVFWRLNRKEPAFFEVL